MDKQEIQIRLHEKYPNEDLEIIEFHNSVKKPGKIKCKTCGRVYSFSAMGSAILKSKKNLCQECGRRGKIKKQFEQSLRDKFPDEPLRLLEFTAKTLPATIQCGKCGRSYTYENASSIKKRKHICGHCHPLKIRDSEMQRTLNIFQEYTDNSDDWVLVQSLEGVHAGDLVQCQCTHCGKVNAKNVYDYLKGIHCQCNRWTDLKQNIEKMCAQEGYALLSGGTTITDKLYLRHRCGFEYSVSPRTFMDFGGRCPKCERKHSKGERKIQSSLDMLDVSYEFEFPCVIEGHVLRFDFYLPEYDYFIEYRGKQHHESIERFGGTERFYQIQQYDNLKRKYYGYKLLEISCEQFDDIDSIIKSLVQRLWRKPVDDSIIEKESDA